MEKKQINHHNKKVFYRVAGEGKTIIFIHGFGEDGEIWTNQLNFFQNRYHIIIPDLPGSGLSEMIDDMSMEGMAESIKSILDYEAVMSFCIIGHSMGGYIGLAFAEKYHSNLIGFGLFHSSAYADSEEKKSVRRKGIDFIIEHGAQEFLKNTLPNLYSDTTKQKNPRLLSEQIANSSNFSAASLVSYYRSMMQRPDRTEILKKAKIPVLFIMGQHDTAVPLIDGLRQCHLPEKSYIHILLQSGHMGMCEEPEKSNQFLERYLKSI